MVQSNPDDRLVALAKAGRIEAFEELVDRHRDVMYRVALRMCGEKEDAEDTLQEAFVKAFMFLESFRGDSSFRTWLFRIAANSCFASRRKKQVDALSLDSYFENRDGSPAPMEVPDWSFDPEKHLLDKEMAGMLERQIAALPQEYRLVLILRDIEGFSAQEVSEITGLSIPAVKSRLHRARVFVRDRLDHYFAEAK